MNIRTIIEVFIASIMVGSYFVYCGKACLTNDHAIKNFKQFLLIFGLILFITINYLVLDNFTRVITIYIMVLFAYKYLFKKNIAQCAITSLIVYLFLVIGEILFMLTLTTLQTLDIVKNMDIFTGSIVANVFVCLVALLLFSLVKNPTNKMLIKVKENNKFTLSFTFLSVMMVIGLLLFNMAFSNWKVDDALFLNIVMTICLVYIGMIIIKQHIEKLKINDEYEKNVGYYRESEKLVEQYSMSQHEHINELIMIRSMVHKSNKKLIEYLNEIIDNKACINNAWIKDLLYIPFGGLKGIMHNKISIMKEQGINVFVGISKDIGKSNLKYLNIKENNQLSKIISVFLDNAKEASILSEDKEVSINVYMENEKVVFEISNSFINDVDLDKIYDFGHSSKGKNRGYGLPIVKTIVDENNIFENETKIIKGYFVQTLKVNVKK